jgi:predicted nucleic acid-binding Zn ribbon protein
MASNDHSLRDVLQEILKKYRLEDHLNETKLIENWEKVTGTMISSHTTNLWVSNKVLHVTVDTGALRQELLYRKEKLIELLNQSAGREVIRDIVFR